MRKESNLHPIVVSKMAELIANRKSTSEGLDLDPKIGYFEDEFITSTFLMEEEEQEQLIRLYTEHVAGVKLPTDWENNLVARRSFLDNVGRTLNNVK